MTSVPRSKVFLNGKIVDASQAHVSVFDHGFLYGDGVYETVRVYGSKVFHWPDHFRRLRTSARRIALRCPWSSAFLLRAVQKVLKANRQLTASVRITVARGPGPLGLDPALCPQPTLAMLLLPERSLEKIWSDGIVIGLVSVRRNHPRCLDPRIKSNNSLNTILAKMEAEKMGVFEGVLLNLDGFLTEGTISNLFFVRKNVVHTPSLDCGLLEGITRAHVLRLARRAGYPVREGRYTPRDLTRADEAFLSSTTLEVAPIIRILRWKGRQPATVWKAAGGPGPVTRHLQALFRASVRRESDG